MMGIKNEILYGSQSGNYKLDHLLEAIFYVIQEPVSLRIEYMMIPRGSALKTVADFPLPLAADAENVALRVCFSPCS